MTTQQLNARLKSYFQRGDIPTQEEFAELIDAVNYSAIDNTRLPEQIDLTVRGQSSSLTAKALIGDGSAVTDLANAHLPKQIDLTAVEGTDTATLTADEIHGKLIGDGSAVTDLANAHLPKQIDLTAIEGTDTATLTADEIRGKFIGDGSELSNIGIGNLPIATLEEILAGEQSKLTTAQHGAWLNQKIDALSCPKLKAFTVACIETTQHIDIDNVPGEIDGYALRDGDLVLLNAQQNQSENHIWQVNQLTEGVSVQPTDLYLPTDMQQGDAVVISHGTAYQNKVFLLKTYRQENSDLFEWQATETLSIAGAGLRQDKNLLHVDFASNDDVTNGASNKVVDSAILQQSLAAAQQQIQAQLPYIEPHAQSSDFSINTNAVVFLDMHASQTITASVSEQVTHFRLQDFQATWGADTQVIVQFDGGASLTLVLDSAHAYYDVYKINGDFYSYDSTGKFLI